MTDEEALLRAVEVLGRLEERTSTTNVVVAEVKTRQDDHEEASDKRFGNLERWQQRILGGAMLLGLMAPIFILGIRESIADLFR